jgi:L-methionine (R)-S-oxide reductase
MTSPSDAAFLDGFLAAHGGVAGSVHRMAGGELVLSVAKNLPPPVVEAVRRVPFGRGMAGQAAQTKRPFQTCNLKSDPSATVRPGARTVAAQAAVALPVLDPTGAVRAVVGIAFAREGELAEPEIATLRAAANRLPSGV